MQLEALLSVGFMQKLYVYWERKPRYTRLPRGGEVEYVQRNPGSRRRRQNGKFRIWDSKIWSRVPRDSDPRMNALSRTSNNWERQTRPVVRESAPYFRYGSRYRYAMPLNVASKENGVTFEALTVNECTKMFWGDQLRITRNLLVI
jgi:hypothetical protein